MKRYVLFLATTLAVFCVGNGHAAASHGYQEFTSSGAFVVPKGVKVLHVEMWGAGGGGGIGVSGGSAATGGGGGAGGYARGYLAVKSGQSLTINVGTAGQGGTGGQSSSSGSASTISDAASNTLATAGGGGSGGAAAASAGGGAGGGGGGSGPQFLIRNGRSGLSGEAGSNIVLPTTAVQGTVELVDTDTGIQPGSGGSGGSVFVGFTNGHDGGRGHVILNW